ncbi:MAG: hypothetical protein GC172_04915 [Phycisphaera sp.]|nr:hypothetical protein [Phycisphaera sp.]
MTGDLGAMTVAGYLDALAAAQPVPGGGAVAGMTLAQANALGSMVAGYAIGKAKFAAHDAVHRAAHERFEKGRRAAIDFAREDAVAYEHLNRLWKLPKEDPLRAGFADAVRAAIRAPEETLLLAKSTLDALELLVGTTSASLASDLRIAVDLAAAAARAAQENVRINLPSISDEGERASISARTEAALHACEAKARDLIARA